MRSCPPHPWVVDFRNCPSGYSPPMVCHSAPTTLPVADIGLCTSIRIVQTIWAWFFILIIAFRYIPNSVVTKPVGAVWRPLVSKPFFKLPWLVRLGLGWAVLLAIVLGSAFGFPLPPVSFSLISMFACFPDPEFLQGTGYGDRAISVFGLLVFQVCLYLSSLHKKHVPW